MTGLRHGLGHRLVRAGRGGGTLVAAVTLVVAGVVGVPAAASAASPVLYASATGTGDCFSVANACSLATALGYVGAGGTVELVTPGLSAHYDGGFTVATAGTSASAPVTIEPAAGVADPTLDGGGTRTVLTVDSGVYLDVSGVTITGGSSPGFGGGIDNGGSSVSITDSTISGNTAAAAGGIYTGGSLSITDSTVSGNTANGNAGGIYNDGGSLSITASTVSGNTANGSAGGVYNVVYNAYGSLSITDSTVSGNTASAGAGVDNNGSGSVSLRADVLASPGGPPSGGECVGGALFFTDQGFNVADDSTCGFSTATSVVSTAAGDLGPLEDNGGPTQTVEPTAGNPAIGIIPVGTAGLCPATDQRGVASVSGVACDAGAVQVAAQAIVFGSSPPSPAVYGGSYTSAATGGGSGNPVVISVDASSTGCTAGTGGTVVFSGVGSCVVDANQAGGQQYVAAAQVHQSFSVSPASQTITFAGPTSGTVGSSVTLSATGGGSGNPVVFSVDTSATPGACSVSGTDGATLEFTGAGTCVVDANQAGDAYYSAAGQVSVSVPVGVAASLVFSGAIDYANAGPITSGSVTVNPASGAVESAQGTVTIPGAHGGTATVSVRVVRYFGIYLGTVTVTDPGAGLSTTALIATMQLARSPGGGITATAVGVAPLPDPPAGLGNRYSDFGRRYGFYRLVFTI